VSRVGNVANAKRRTQNKGTRTWLPRPPPKPTVTPKQPPRPVQPKHQIDADKALGRAGGEATFGCLSMTRTGGSHSRTHGLLLRWVIVDVCQSLAAKRKRIAVAASMQGALLFGTDHQVASRRERVSFKELQRRGKI